MITEKVGPYYFFMQGFRDVQVDDPKKLLKALRNAFGKMELQLLRADRIADREHLLFAARNAVDSFKGKDRRTKHFSMEFLLFVSGEHQIVEAIELLGVTPSTKELVLAGFSEADPDLDFLAETVLQMLRGVPDDSVMGFQNQKKLADLRRAYKISDKEMKSSRVLGETSKMVLQRLVIERSAMLVLEN